MAEKSVRLRGVAALSIATVGLAMGAIPAADAQTSGTGAGAPSTCNDFIAVFNKAGGAFHNFLKSEYPFFKFQDERAQRFVKIDGAPGGFLKFDGAPNGFAKFDGGPNGFLKFEGAQSGFLKYETNIASFYKVSTGGVDIFLKDAVDETNLPAVQYCISDGNGVSRGFFSKVTDYNGNTTLAGAHVSFAKVDGSQAFLKIELQAVSIEAQITVGKDGKATAAIDEVANNSDVIN